MLSMSGNVKRNVGRCHTLILPQIKSNLRRHIIYRWHKNNHSKNKGLYVSSSIWRALPPLPRWITQQLYHASTSITHLHLPLKEWRLTRFSSLTKVTQLLRDKAEAGIQVCLMAKASSQSPSATLSWDNVFLKFTLAFGWFLWGNEKAKLIC